MKAEARALGARVIAAEEELDRLFAGGAAADASLAAATGAVAALGGELRAAHLRTHIAMRGVLTPRQAARYAELRGHGGALHRHGAH